MVKLGDFVRDSITGFSGVATARSEYLYGCVHIQVTPAELKDGRPVEPQWLDEARLNDSPSALTGGPASAPPARSHSR